MLSVNQRIGKYKILAHRGGMGEVFLAKDTQLDKKVTLKILPAPLAGMFTFITRRTLRTLLLWGSTCFLFVVS